MHMMSHVKVCFSTTYHVLVVYAKNFPYELYALKLTMGFQRRLAHLSGGALYIMFENHVRS
jgi:hypothetical protein